ncbi:MAG: Hsp20 family protein [Patescibacteria group bacterium]
MENRINKLKDLRRNKNLSQEQVAKELGVSRQTIFALEKGLWEPSLTLAFKICDLFDLALPEIFEIENNNIFPQKIGEKGDIMEKDLTPWSPFRGLGELHRDIDRFFDDSFASGNASNIRVPAMNIHEKGNDFVIEVAVPGYQEDEINVEVGDDYLTLRGEKKEEQEEKDKKFHRKEFVYGSFERTVAFPSLVDDEKVTADLSDGTLKIVIPKKEPVKPKVRKIKVVKK